MLQDRQMLRKLLKALIDERTDADGLYIPRGEEGMRRMIRALLDMRPAGRGNAQTEELIRAFESEDAKQ